MALAYSYVVCSSTNFVVVLGLSVSLCLAGCESKKSKEEEITIQHQNEAIKLANTPPDFNYFPEKKAPVIILQRQVFNMYEFLSLEIVLNSQLCF